jgi:hypothetical protein
MYYQRVLGKIMELVDTDNTDFAPTINCAVFALTVAEIDESPLIYITESFNCTLPAIVTTLVWTIILTDPPD